MSTPTAESDHPRRARALLERCGVSSRGLSDADALARAAQIVDAVAAYRGADLAARWEEHVNAEFKLHDVEATMATMVEEPYVHNVPTAIGGRGGAGVRRFYSEHMIPRLPADMEVVPVSRTIGADRLVDELIVRFTHDREIDFMLPGVAPTGKRVELPHVAVVGFNAGKISHEHIWWDQASLLLQVGLLPPGHLPVAGPEAAHALIALTQSRGQAFTS